MSSNIELVSCRYFGFWSLYHFRRYFPCLNYFDRYVSTRSNPLLSTGGGRGINGKILENLEKTSLVLLPLQGFFNFVIFLSHKVYNYRRVHKNESISHVLALLFCTSTSDPFFISRISVVKQYEEEEREEEQEEEEREYVEVSSDDFEHEIGSGQRRFDIYDVDIHDESDTELHYRLKLMNVGTHGNTNRSDLENPYSRISRGGLLSEESVHCSDGER
jgi:hypothetical protein